MKTNLENLSRIYQEHLRGRGLAPARACPPPERLVQCVMGEMPAEERQEVVRHAADCAACAASLKHVLALSEETDRAAAGLEAAWETRKGERLPDKKAIWRQPVVKPAVAALAGVLLIAILVVSVSRLAERPATRGGTGARIALVFPVKAEAPRDGLEFKWQGMSAASSYTVEIFDKSFRLIWRSERVAGTEARPPADVLGRLTAGETYYWSVAAATDDLREVRSGLAAFSVK
jgi:hypothetical protein